MPKNELALPIRLSDAEINTIIGMCAIADAQERSEDGGGEGDYQEWTGADFTVAKQLKAKMHRLLKSR